MDADWLVSHLTNRSPEVVFLILTPIAIVPATSPFAGALLLMAAIPMMSIAADFRHREAVPSERCRAPKLSAPFVN